MSKFIIAVLSITLLSAAVALALSRWVDFSSFSDIRIDDNQYKVNSANFKNIKQTESFSDVKDIDIEVSTGSISIEKSNSNQVEVEYEARIDKDMQDNKAADLIKLNNGKLKIEMGEINDSNIRIGKLFKLNRTKENWIEPISLKIKIPNNLQRIKISTALSDIDLENIKTDQLEIATVNGRINANNCQIETLEVDAVNGSVSLDGGIFNQIKNSSVNGSFKFTSNELKKYSLQSEGLSIDVVGANLLGSNQDKKIEISTLNGKIEFLEKANR